MYNDTFSSPGWTSRNSCSPFHSFTYDALHACPLAQGADHIRRSIASKSTLIPCCKSITRENYRGVNIIWGRKKDMKFVILIANNDIAGTSDWTRLHVRLYWAATGREMKTDVSEGRNYPALLRSIHVESEGQSDGYAQDTHLHTHTHTHTEEAGPILPHPFQKKHLPFHMVRIQHHLYSSHLSLCISHLSLCILSRRLKKPPERLPAGSEIIKLLSKVYLTVSG